VAIPIHHINQDKKFVAVISGACEILVAHRELRNKYQTNRSIKTWATYFLLKSLTTSGILRDWTKQKQTILSFCKMTENCFRIRLAELQKLNLITLQSNRTIKLVAFEKAAEILGIIYDGTIKIEYDDTLPGQQIFQYFLRAEEIRSNQHKQLKALWYYAGKQPLLKDALITMLIQQNGCEEKDLRSNVSNFQQQLLKLQQHAFKEGSPLLDIIHTFRADINRSVNCIQDHHGYRSKQSVSYMKKVMLKSNIITVTKVCIESTNRSRLYVVVDGKRKRDAYKYIAARQTTAWFLTDQIDCVFKTEQINQTPNEKGKKQKAA